MSNEWCIIKHDHDNDDILLCLSRLLIIEIEIMFIYLYFSCVNPLFSCSRERVPCNTNITHHLIQSQG